MSGLINVCTCFDEKNADAAIVLIQSILMNIKLKSKIHIHAITSDREFNCNEYFDTEDGVAFTTYNVSNPFANWPSKDYISVGTYLRFMMSDLLSGLDRVLYLDADTIVNTDLREVYDTDLQGRPLAAMSDYGLVMGSPNWGDFRVSYDGTSYRFNEYTQKVLGICKQDRFEYFNAGVLLIDLKRWKYINALALEYLQENPALPFLDQDALSHAVAGHFIRLDPRYNAFSDSASPDGRTIIDKMRGFAKEYAAIRKLWRDPWIIHYAGSKKPWRLGVENTALEHYWWHYARHSPVYDRLVDIERSKENKPVIARRC